MHRVQLFCSLTNADIYAKEEPSQEADASRQEDDEGHVHIQNRALRIAPSIKAARAQVPSHLIAGTPERNQSADVRESVTADADSDQLVRNFRVRDVVLQHEETDHRYRDAHNCVGQRYAEGPAEGCEALGEACNPEYLACDK